MVSVFGVYCWLEGHFLLKIDNWYFGKKMDGEGNDLSFDTRPQFSQNVQIFCVKIQLKKFFFHFRCIVRSLPTSRKLSGGARERIKINICKWFSIWSSSSRGVPKRMFFVVVICVKMEFSQKIFCPGRKTTKTTHMIIICQLHFFDFRKCRFYLK